MENEILKKLNDEIEDQIDELCRLDNGSDAKNKATKDLEVLYDLRLREMKLKNEAADIELKRELEMDKLNRDDNRLEAQIVEQRKERRMKWVLGSLKLLGYGACFAAGMKFEETGTFGSKIFGNHLSGLKPKL